MTIENWLGESNKIGIDIWRYKYQYKNETFDEWLNRVSNNNQELKNIIRDKKFLFGGRVLSNRGLNNGNYFNCFSAGYVEDDYADIMEVSKKIGLTFKAQGGQGISLSKIRPKGTLIANRYESDGIIPFMELFNSVTSITSQAGSRKGALIMTLDIRHKEAEEFIKIKSDTDKITKANLSLEIDDEFMNAVKEFYASGKIVTLHETRIYGNSTVEYDVTPIKLYKLMMEYAYDYGEPGCLFTNAFRNYNLMEFHPDYNVETSNPCGEQPLKKDTSCNLGSINLANFVLDEYTDGARVNYADLAETIRIAITALDDIIDENLPNLPLEIHKTNAKNWRNVGLGTMGLADMLFKLRITYGSEIAKNFIKTLYSFIFTEALKVDIELAKERGAFPKFDGIQVGKATILQEIFESNPDIKKNFYVYGLRNCSLLSIAPTGSISTMLNVSGGVEPQFAISYTRKTDNLNESYKVYCGEAQYYMNTYKTDVLPECFVCSADIYWKDRIDMQANMQKYIDTAISSTVNLPQETTISEIEQLYLYAWQKKLKGITIFRSGCKRAAILIAGNNNSEEKKLRYTKLSRGDIINCSQDLIGKKRKLQTGCGSLHVLAYFDPIDGSLQEVYLNKGSTGGCANFTAGLSRMISLLCRAGVSVDKIKDQLDSTGVCPSYATRRATKGDTSKGSCCPMAIGNALVEMNNEMAAEIDEMADCYTSSEVKHTESKETSFDSNPKCPRCGEFLVLEEGCIDCKSCGWSKC